jgi:hypothetical protein
VCLRLHAALLFCSPEPGAHAAAVAPISSGAAACGDGERARHTLERERAQFVMQKFNPSFVQCCAHLRRVLAYLWLILPQPSMARWELLRLLSLHLPRWVKRVMPQLDTMKRREKERGTEVHHFQRDTLSLITADEIIL